MALEKRLRLAVGIALWMAVLSGIAASAYTVYARASRNAERLTLRDVSACRLAPGDMVFAESDGGLAHVGEVSFTDADSDAVTISISRDAFAGLNVSTRVVCWRTPLSVENAIETLLPPRIQRRAAEQIAMDWREHDAIVLEAWTPVVAELTSAYLQVISEDLEGALRRHEDELLSIARAHGQGISQDWPAIQRKLGPILQQHLTPVLSRLVTDGLVEAPKLSIAWNVARGRNADAYRIMLDWLADYLANMPEKDKAEMGAAVRRAWEAAGRDKELRDRLARIGRRIVEDPELQRVIEEIYAEAVSRNPRTAEFLQSRVLESPELREKMYAFIELFGPTARKVAALCLFDETGTTRPEVVHLVRSVALGRRISWVTLRTYDPHGAALESGATLRVYDGDAGS